MSASVVRSTATILPEAVFTNEDIAEVLIEGSGDEADETERSRVRSRAQDFQRKTGLRERRFFAIADDPVEIAHAALEQLVERGHVAWSALDGIIVSSSSIHGFPGVSQQLVARARRDHGDLGNPFVLDIGSNACTSFMYGLGLATSLVAAQGYRHVACLAVEFSSRCLVYKAAAFATSALFGDAVTGVMVGRDGSPCARIVSTRMGSRIDSERVQQIHGAGVVAFDPAGHAPEPERWYMSGPPVAIEAIDILVAEIRRYQDAGIEVDWLIPHQANLARILHPACDTAGIARARLRSSFEWTGNTSSASIPLVLDELLTSGSARSGDNVIMIGFGASFSIGSAHLVIA